jgi:hypothetical protein
MGHQDLHDASDVPSLLGAGVELAIGVGAGTSLSKAVVGVGMHDAFLIDSSEVTSTGTHVFSPLEENGLDPEFDGAQCRKKSCRPCSYDQDGLDLGYVFVGRKMIE